MTTTATKEPTAPTLHPDARAGLERLEASGLQLLGLARALDQAADQDAGGLRELLERVRVVALEASRAAQAVRAAVAPAPTRLRRIVTLPSELDTLALAAEAAARDPLGSLRTDPSPRWLVVWSRLETLANVTALLAERELRPRGVVGP